MIDVRWQMSNMINFLIHQSSLAIILEFLLLLGVVMYFYFRYEKHLDSYMNKKVKKK